MLAPGPRIAAMVLALVWISGCAATGSEDGGPPVVAVTTTVLGDVVERLVGDQADVVTVMPRGASPHDFQASARQAAVLADAAAIVVNGGGFEEGLVSVVEGAAADGVPVIDALAEAAGSSGTEPHADHGEHQHDGQDDHDGDPHFFTDPLRMADAVDGIAGALAAEVPSLDAEALTRAAGALRADLERLHEELAATLEAVPDDRRTLVTDHDVFGPFADRYGFEVVATVVPSGSTTDGVSGGAMAELVDTLRRTGAPAIFTEATASARLADTIASEVGDVEVVALHAETLGPEGSGAGTYAGMLRTNAERIAAALGES